MSKLFKSGTTVREKLYTIRLVEARINELNNKTEVDGAMIYLNKLKEEIDIEFSEDKI